jgi:hypothetical protein
MRYEYENLVKLFETSLLTDLRGHGSSSEFLRLWVPDPDPAKSLVNMADSATLEKVDAFEVDIAAQLMPAAQVKELTDMLKGSFTVTSNAANNGRLILKFVSESQ